MYNLILDVSILSNKMKFFVNNKVVTESEAFIADNFQYSMTVDNCLITVISTMIGSF